MLAWRDMRHPAGGGAEVWTHEVCKELVRRGHDVTLFAAGVADAPDEEVVGGYRIVRGGGRLGVYRQARVFWQHEQRRTGRVPFDVVIDQMNTLPFLAHRWAHGAKVLCMAHQVCREIWWHEVPFHHAAVGRFVIEPAALRSMRRVPTVTVSESSAESLRDAGFGDVRVLPQGANLPTCPPAVDKTPFPSVVFCGRLVASKRPDHVVQAFVAAKRNGLDPDARLRIIGDGPLRSELEGAVPHGVDICGRVSEVEKLELMASSWMLAATSVREGWGLIVSEAAACGTASVGYRVPGLVDSVAASGGLLVDADIEALAGVFGSELPAWRDRRPSGVGVVSWSQVVDSLVGALDDVPAFA